MRNTASAVVRGAPTIEAMAIGPHASHPSVLSMMASRMVLRSIGVTQDGQAAPRRWLGPPRAGKPPAGFLETYLKSYYEHCVIGGLGAFVLGVGDPADFEKAIRRKVVNEIAGLSALLQLASNERLDLPAADCLTHGQYQYR
jgi:hypothetical protein